MRTIGMGKLNAMAIAIAVALAMGTMCISQGVQAQAQTAEVRSYDIPAGQLSESLKQFGMQSRLQLLAPPELTKGLSGNPVTGTYTASQALDRLLANSGLSYEFVNATTVVIKKAPGPTPIKSKSPSGSTGDAKEKAHSAPTVLDAVTVTGSRIRGAPPASPVTTLTREDMARLGYVDLGDAARGLVQNFSGGQNPGVAGGGDQGGENLNNSSALNLRGLGPDATLTLVNGHRVAYDGVFQGVDIAAIPIAAVERIEVVTDGASALYGSDAVGGVANVILRRDFRGVEASARYGGSTDGGDRQQEYSVTTGGKWTSGGVMAAFDYSRYTAIDARNRSYTQGLYGSQSLIPGQEQHSAVVAGHQRLTDRLALELDASFNDRTSELVNDFSTTAPVTTSGLWNFPKVKSYEVTPTLRYQLPGGWETSLSGTYARSKTVIHNRVFSQGAESYRTLLIYADDADSIEFNAEGPLFAAPGGEARLAIGAGYRSTRLNANWARTIAGVTSTTLNIADSRDVYFSYGELSVPLVSPAANLHFAHELTFNAALRHESYRGSWGVTTPKFGLIFAPTPDITLRATWGKSFKAATLYQQNTAAAAYLIPGMYFVPPPSGGRSVLTLTGVPAPLDPERATTWTASIGVHPDAIPDLAVEATYWDIRYRDRIASPVPSPSTALGNPIFDRFVVYDPTAQQVLNAIAGLPGGFSNQTGQPFDPANVGAIINDSLSNVARANLHGVDLTGNYGMDIGANSRLSLTAAASYLESDRQISAGQPTLQLAGLIFNPPHWRARAGATWQRANLTLTGTLNYIGGERDNRYQPIEQVGSFTTLDVVTQIRSNASDGFFHDCEIGLSALNLLNKKPDVIRNSNPIDPPYDSLNYSVVGRFLGIAFTKKFL